MKYNNILLFANKMEIYNLKFCIYFVKLLKSKQSHTLSVGTLIVTTSVDSFISSISDNTVCILRYIYFFQAKFPKKQSLRQE